MSLSLSISQRIRQAQRLSVSQKQKLLGYLGELEDAVYGPQFSIKEYQRVGCPSCGATMPMSSPEGYKCISCNRAYSHEEAIAVTFYDAGRVGDNNSLITVRKFDEEVFHEKMKNLSPFITPGALYDQDRSFYLNIMRQFGSLEKAFASVGMVYANPAKEKWQETIMNYVGILTDTAIAKIVGVSIMTIWTYRHRFGIASASDNFRDAEISEDIVLQIRELNEKKILGELKSLTSLRFKNIKDEVKKMIAENPSKRDGEIKALLKEKGVVLARRTINKYRHE